MGGILPDIKPAVFEKDPQLVTFKIVFRATL